MALPTQRLLLGLLLCVWLTAQTFGLVHRERHGGVPGASTSATLLLASFAAPPGAAADKSTGLFAGHVQSSDCRLYDHAGLADLLLCVPALAAQAVFVPRVPAFFYADVPDPRQVPFQARGPPTLR